MGMDINEHIKTIVAAVTLIGLLGSTAGSFFAWLEKRNIKAKYQDEINLAERRIVFLTSWFKAQEPLCSAERLAEIKQETSTELDQLRRKLTQFIAESEQHPVYSRNRTLQKTFLLFLPHNLGGWICHILYYFVLATALLYVSVTPETNDVRSWLSWALDSAVGLVIFAIPLFLLYSLAMRFNKKRD